MTKALRHLLAAAAAVTTVLLAPAYGADPIPGDFDRTFANDTGFLNSAFAGPLPSASKVAVAVQDDGKYVVATTCGAVFTDMCVFRVTPGGGFDASFVGPDPGLPGNGKAIVAIGSGNSGATAVMVQRDGRIVVAGFCELNGHRTYCVARLNRDGSYDASFIGPDRKQPANGRVVLPGAAGLMPDRYLAAAVLQEDQRIVLAGYCYQTQANVLRSSFCLARLNPDGSLDQGFDGPDAAAPGNGQFALHLGPEENFATSVALRPDGELIVGGYCNTAITVPVVCVMQLSPDGNVDDSVAGNVGRAGETRLLINGLGSTARAVRVQADGKVVIAGDCIAGGWLQICAARLRRDGALDASFAIDGTLRVPIDSTHASAASVALQDDGRIVLAGTCATPEQSRICALRLHSDGTLDSTFDGPAGVGNGLIQLPRQSGEDRNSALVLLKDARLLVAGSCRGTQDDDNLCVARLHGGPFEALRCSFDVDGDGIVSNDSDLLMLMRVARGLRGTGVTQGINFSPAATRREWSSVQHFLRTQCRLPVAP